MSQITNIILLVNFVLTLSLAVNATSEFDLPLAKIYEVDENDRIVRPWDKVVNSEAVIEGVNSVRLECTANHPIQWIYSGNGIPVSSSKITVSRQRVSKELETVHRASIFINPLKEHHTGKYQCSGTEVLDLSTFIYVYVPGQALFSSLNGKNIHIQKNETTVLIPCTISNPSAVVSLDKQIGQVLQHIQPKSPETVVYNPREGFTVKLDELDGDPEGIYVCTAKYNHLVRGVEYTVKLNNHFNTFQPESSTSGSLCTNHTCGDNAICQIVNGNPTCQCEEMFIGDAENACSLKCDAHTDCPDNKSCFTDKECRSPCIHSVHGCGINSLCRVVNHRPECSCPEDFIGDPKQQCFNSLQGSPPDSPPAPDETDMPSSAGSPTKCKQNEDCKIDRQCRRIGTSLKCVDACFFVQCGLNSKCTMANHNPYCNCQPGFIGDPYNECRPSRLEMEYPVSTSSDREASSAPAASTAAETCQKPENCGPFSKCRINKRGRERCSCLEGYTGEPPNCTAVACQANRDCQVNQVCSNSASIGQTIGSPICLNVCGNRVCGERAECSGTGICTCPLGFVGDALKNCVDISSKLNQDCTIDNDCGDSLRCETGASYRKCTNPCNQIKCFRGTSCLAEKHNANCECPHGFTGNSVIGCTPDLTVDNFGRPSGES